MAQIADKAILTTREAWVYCGSRPMFERIQKEFPELLTPFSKGKSTGKTGSGSPASGKTTYLKSVIDQALKAAQMDGRFAS